MCLFWIYCVFKKAFKMSSCTIIVILLFTVFNFGQSVLLYKNTPNIQELNSYNFGNNVNRGDSAYLIQFYNHNCPHCTQYVSTWQRFARSIEAWDPLVKVAVINCAENTRQGALCAQQAVWSVPTIKYYGFQHYSSYNKAWYSGYKYDTSLLEDTLAYFVANDNSKPSHAPSFTQMSRNTQVSSVASPQAQTVAVVFENNSKKLADKLILDFSKQKTLQILSASHDHYSIQGRSAYMPAMMVYNKGYWDGPIFVSKEQVSRNAAQVMLRRKARL